MKITNTAEYKTLADELASQGYASSDLTFEVLDAMFATLNAFCVGPFHDDFEQFEEKLKRHIKRSSWYR